MERIRISSATNRRNPEMLIDLIRAYAVLYQIQRKREVVDGMPVIFAKRSDFYRAASLYERLNGEAGGQSTKLTRREAALIKAIRETGYSEITVTQMQQATSGEQQHLQTPPRVHEPGGDLFGASREVSGDLVL